MKCIGPKSEAIYYLSFFDSFLVAFCILMMIGLKAEAWFILFPLMISIVVLCWFLYLLFSLPKEIVLYDDNAKLLTVWINKRISKTFFLSEIQTLHVDRPYLRANWCKLQVILKNGEEISVTGISLENQIIDSVMTLKK